MYRPKRAKAARLRRACEASNEGRKLEGLRHSINPFDRHQPRHRTTSLALLALMKAEGHDDAVRKGVEC